MLKGMIKTVVEQLAEMLAEAGVKRMYGVADGMSNSVTDVLQRRGRIRWIRVMREETAALAASAEAQITGEIASCCVSYNPGNMHLLHGLYDAWRSDAPVFALATHMPSTQAHDEDFQEPNPQLYPRERVGYCEMISEPLQTASVVGHALRAAQESPGVGAVVLSADMAERSAVLLPPIEKSGGKPSVTIPSSDDLQEMARLINAGKRVTFFCGRGCAEGREEVVRLAEKVCAPIAYTLRGKEVMEKDNPFAVGMTGLLGWGDAMQAMYDCDVLVMWGTDFPYSSFLPNGKQVTIVQVDRKASHLGRRADVSLGIQGDVAATAAALLPLVAAGRSDEHLERSLARHRKLCRKLFSCVNYVNENNPLRPEYVTHIVSEQAEPDAVFVIDTGTPDIWAARYLAVNGTRRVLGAFDHCGAACGTAMALGAQASCPGRQVIALCDEGGLILSMGDLLTLSRENLPVKLLVYDHSPFDGISTEEKNTGGKRAFEEWQSYDLTAAVRAMGLYAERLEEPFHAVESVRRWLRQPGPALLDVAADAYATAVPPDIALMHAYGFATALTKEALQGELRPARELLFGRAQLF